MKKAVVTGANGFIGKSMVKKLIASDYYVYGVGTEDNFDDIDKSKFTFIKAYFEDYPNLKKIIHDDIDCFYHFAWQGVFGNAFKDYKLQMENAIHSGDAIKAAIDLKAKAFILASTVNVLESIKINCDVKPRFTSIYASAKFAAENICRTYAYDNNIKFNCGIIGMVYGPNNFSRMVPNVVINSLIHGHSPSLIEGNNLYDLVYIDDVVSAFLAIGEKGLPNKTYYVGSSKLCTFKELFTKIGQIVNPDIKLNFGTYPDENAIDYSLIDIAALKKDTGYICGNNFEDNIIKTAEWLKKINWQEKVES